MPRRIILILPVLSALFAAGAAVRSFGETPSSLDFGKHIRPILSENCFECHGPDAEERKGDLRLDVREEALKVGTDGAAIVPGEPDRSLVVERMQTDDPDDLMPPPESHKSLTAAEKKRLVQWIQEGAVYTEHWAFVPPVKKALPSKAHPVDAWVDQELKAQKMTASDRADDETLVRRAYLDLTGLPPSPEAIDAYMADSSSDRWLRLINRLLESPHGAERLAMPWLDAARYSDTNGFSIDDHRDMWGWRDWVLNAFLTNKPYDEFLIEQIAGDLIPEASPDQRAATGFLRNSMNTHEGGTIAEEYRVAYTIDKVDTVATSVLGLTMKCAQCHDHKYDPISQKDYFRFFAFFNETSEPGKGATNGNTKPIMEYVSPLGAGLDDLRARIAELEHLLLHPSARLVAARAAWIDSQPTSSAPPVSEISFPWEHADSRDAAWIWAGKPLENQRIQLSKTVEVSEKPDRAWLFTTCDDESTVNFNGTVAATITLWSTPVLVDLTDRMKAGQNEISVTAKNNGGLGGFIAILAWEKNGKWKIVSSDAEWIGQVSPDAPKSPATVVGKLGDGPWKDVTASFRKASEQGNVAEALNVAEQNRTAEHWKQINTAFVKSKTPGSQGMKQLQASIEVEIKVLQADLNRGKTTVMVMDHQPALRKTHILTRGAYDQPGAEVTPGTPEILPALDSAGRATRLELASWLVRTDHPLTSRVAVNRFWQMLFGTGLVETSEDFGNQGAWPSHPELLDWLAVDFVEHNWDVRHLLRTILTSEMYARSAVTTPAQLAADPLNRLYARSPRPRLSAEIIRDQALAVSGLLHPAIGGPSVHPPQPEGLWRDISHFGHPTVFTAQHFYPGQGPNAHRRSMYTFWKRTSAPPALAMFDAPTRETCTIRRMRTNTPLQALVTMNDPQFLAAAARLGERMAMAASSPLELGFRLVSGRAPDGEERAILEKTYDHFYDRYTEDPAAARALLASLGHDQMSPEAGAYTLVASLLMNLDETLTRP